MTRKNDSFVAKIVNTHLTKIFMTIFAPDERLPKCQVLPPCVAKNSFSQALSHLEIWLPAPGWILQPGAALALAVLFVTADCEGDLVQVTKDKDGTNNDDDVDED